MNPDNKTRVTVDIYGTQYKLMGTSTAEHVKKVAGQVNEQMTKIAKGHPRLDIQRIAVLAAINMADEFAKAKQEWLEAEKNAQRHDETRSRELAELRGQYAELLKLSEELQKEQAEHKRREEELLRQIQAYEAEVAALEQQKTADQHMSNDFRKLQQEFVDLKDEYAKLKQEYNEWIQLIEQEQPEPN